MTARYKKQRNVTSLLVGDKDSLTVGYHELIEQAQISPACHVLSLMLWDRLRVCTA